MASAQRDPESPFRRSIHRSLRSCGPRPALPTGSPKMTRSHMSRRTMLTGATAFGALVAASPELAAQPARSAKSPSAKLPPRDEFVIRGAHVLTMDPKIADRVAGDVYVRDG